MALGDRIVCEPGARQKLRHRWVKTVENFNEGIYEADELHGCRKAYVDVRHSLWISSAQMFRSTIVYFL